MPWIQHDSSRCALDFCKNSWQDPGVLPILPPGWSKTFGHQLAQWFGTSQQNHKNVLNHVANQSYIPTTVLGIPCCLHCLFHVHLFSPTLFFWKKKHVKIPGSVASRTAVKCQIEVPPLQLRRLMAMWQEWLVYLVRPCATKEGRSFTERDQRLRLTLKDMILTQVTLGKVEEYDDMMILPFERMEKVRCVPV